MCGIPFIFVCLVWNVFSMARGEEPSLRPRPQSGVACVKALSRNQESLQLVHSENWSA